MNKYIDYTLAIECDACLSGAGGNSDQNFYIWDYTPDHLRRFPLIHQLEAVNIVVALRTLCINQPRPGEGVTIYTDNQSSSFALSSGVTTDSVLSACARELWLEAAVRDIDIQILHKPGALIPLADALSRAGVDNS